MKSFGLVGLLGLGLLAGAAQAGTLYDNGPVVDENGLRIHETNLAGLIASTNFDSSVADDFTVGAGGWRVTDVDLYAWTDQNTPSQGGTTLFTFLSATWSIVAGDINSGPVVASGTTAVQRGDIVGYNVQAGDLESKRQAIFDIDVDIPDTQLAAGSYWLTWTFATDQFVGSVSPLDGDPPGNAMTRFRSDTYVPATTGAGLGLPFAVNGVAAAVPEPATSSSLLAGLGLIALVVRGRRRRPER